MSELRHFLDIDQFDGDTLRHILETAARIKRGEGAVNPLADKTLISIFEKPSTRTRVSFQVGMQQFGGNVVVLSQNDSQLGRGETIADTARVLSRYGDIMSIRTDDHQKLVDLAEYATVPVINALTDDSHPCQIMADIMTYKEHRSSISGKTVAWCGDGNNMVTSWVHAAVKFGFALNISCPQELSPSTKLLDWADREGGKVTLGQDVDAAVQGAHLVTTDTWVSMGDKDAEQRNKLLAPYQVNEALMAKAADDALFMHCLPAHRNEEVTAAVLDGPQSVVWDEAENRLHAQKGIIAWCMNVD
jgi:ornithine carbamoyltransferase